MRERGAGDGGGRVGGWSKMMQKQSFLYNAFVDPCWHACISGSDNIRLGLSVACTSYFSSELKGAASSCALSPGVYSTAASIDHLAYRRLAYRRHRKLSERESL